MTAYAFERDEQTDLEETIKVDWSGKLRGLVEERHLDYTGPHRDGEPAPDADPYSVTIWRTLDRLDTKVVVETVEEANALVRHLGKYTDPTHVTWLNPMSAKSARRVQSEIIDAVRGMDGVEAFAGGRTPMIREA